MFWARVMVAGVLFGTIVSPTNFFVVGLARQAELAEWITVSSCSYLNTVIILYRIVQTA